MRECACGCGNPIPKSSRRKYYNEAHKMRAYRERRKQGEVRPRRKSTEPSKEKDPLEEEIDQIHEHVLRRRIEKGEISECARCGRFYVLLSKSDPNYCPSCSGIVGSSSQG